MPWNASDHEKILAALSQNNPVAARKGMVHDIRTTGKALLSVAGPNGLELPFANGSELQFDY